MGITEIHNAKAVIYARYSSDKQDETSTAAQVRACQEYADSHNYTIVKVYSDEAVSGKGSKTYKRVQYQKMLRDAESGAFGTVLIHKYDRVARNVLEHATLANKLSALQIELIAVSQDFGNTKEAKFMKILMWAMSEFYIDNLAEEVKKGHKENALRGLHNGGYAPFGYDIVDQKHVINELEAVYVRRMFSSCLRGDKYNGILSDMKNAGIKGKRGRPITYTAIYEILRNEKYTGVYTYSMNEEEKRTNRRSKPNAIRIENALPVIIERDEWERVQKIMDGRKNNGRKAKTEYLLSGRVFCECGAAMHGLTTHKIKNGKHYDYSYYVCSKKCGAHSIKVEVVDREVFNYLSILLNTDIKSIIEESFHRYVKQLQIASLYTEGATKKQITDLENQKNSLIKNLSSSVLAPAVVSEMGKRIEELNAQIDQLNNQQDIEKPKEFSRKDIMKYFDTLSSLNNESEETRRNVVRYYIERVNVKKNAVNVESTFTAFLESIGCGDRI